jgi:hypothetical protein
MATDVVQGSMIRVSAEHPTIYVNDDGTLDVSDFLGPWHIIRFQRYGGPVTITGIFGYRRVWPSAMSRKRLTIVNYATDDGRAGWTRQRDTFRTAVAARMECERRRYYAANRFDDNYLAPEEG